MKITHHGALPASDPMFGNGLQVFTNPYSEKSSKNTPDSTSEETPTEDATVKEPESLLETPRVPEVDWPTANSNFDKLMDAFESGGEKSMKERFLEQLKEKNRDVNEQGEDGKGTDIGST